MTSTEQGEIVGYISSISPSTYSDIELDEWAHTLTPLDIVREQWEPCVRAWRFTDPPKSGNRLADLYSRLKAIAHQTEMGRVQAARPETDSVLHAMRVRLANNGNEGTEESRRTADAETANMTTEDIVVGFWRNQANACVRLHGHVPRYITEQAALEIRERLMPTSGSQAIELLSRVVGDEQARAFVEHKARIRAKVREIKAKWVTA